MHIEYKILTKIDIFFDFPKNKREETEISSPMLWYLGCLVYSTMTSKIPTA